MGVTGLWTVAQPCARPIKIETLNKKRLAVDASIWVYQFLKAVRDKEGNALRNSHVVGFFRRICKLLFIGIKPVFVFDGGAPALKRQTISGRKQRREGRREDAARTAGKLLALQMQKIAEEEEEKRKREAQRGPELDEEPLPENMVYVDELQMTQQERQQNRKFRKKDQYHLPDLDVSLAEMGGPNDPRIMSLEELEAYARQFDTGEDINVYDFSKIDFDSPFFVSLPASDRYNILNAARLRSRLRMGYSKEQLDTMFPDRMAFSKFQIDRVRERNELTQRLMNINGMADDDMFGAGANSRVAGERGREYVLVKNDGVEGGWALGVVTAKDEGQQNKPIDVDELGKQIKEEEEEEGEDDEDFEDVPIEGLNRLPKQDSAVQGRGDHPVDRVIARQRREYEASRQANTNRRPRAKPKAKAQDPESLFVDDEEMKWEEIPEGNAAGDTAGLFEEEDEDLDRAIAMSMEKDISDEEKEDHLSSFQQTRAEDARPVPKGSFKAIASVMNQRANKVAPARQTPVSAEPESEDDDMDFQAALTESRNDKYKPKTLKPPSPKQPQRRSLQLPKATPQPSKPPAFSGPLPFEKLDLGSSLLGKKKMEKLQEESAGGFERTDTGPQKKKAAEPLPPWFAGNIEEDIAAQKKIETEDRQRAKEFDKSFQFTEGPVLGRSRAPEVIDLDAPKPSGTSQEVIDLDSDDDRGARASVTPTAAEEDATTKMGDVADAVRAVPPSPPAAEATDRVEPVMERHVTEVAADDGTVDQEKASTNQTDEPPKATRSPIPPRQAARPAFEEDEKDEELEWSESDHELQEIPTPAPSKPEAQELAKSPSPDFEDVDIPDQPVNAEKAVEEVAQAPPQALPEQPPTSGLADQNLPPEPEEDFGYYSDSEDEELFRQLEVEAEEHARFASELNHKTQQQNIEDYERELKQLRSQQKKDRRDADEVTHIMITECQQLLKLFGLPYITAPMEAEAQCAELVSLGLVDGIVTDDSDCFLFGGTRIYKNMFNQAKFVECYLASDLEKEFDLTRQKLIGIAHLLGSDYTEGLPGVGPVTALEILSEFPSLNEFRSWWEGVQLNTIPKSEDAGNPFRKKFRRNATKLFLPPSFPDPRVDMAYLEPEVDSDPSPFQWGVPDLSALRSFLMATIGWSQERTDEVLVPVIKDMNRRVDEGTQSNITAFFQGGTGAGAYAPRQRVEQGSKRMGTALTRMARQAKAKRKGGVAAAGDGDAEGEATEVAEDGATDAAQGDGTESEPAKRGPRGKRKSAAGDSAEAAPKRKRKARRVEGD